MDLGNSNMPVERPGPLNDKDYNAINERLRELSEIQRDIDLAVKAGIPCDERQQYCQFLMEKYTNRKRAYFPDRP